MSKTVLVVAGELSGDMHAAHLVRAVKQLQPDVHFFGVGGERMEKEGVEVLYHVRDMAVMGMWEVLKKYGYFRRVFDELVAAAEKRKPDAVLLVDYPGFNLRFAAKMKPLGIKVVYYICPQVWAWKQSRIPKMAELVDRLISIFPFEADVFKETSLRVDYAGHPLVDEAAAALDQPLETLPWKGEKKVALLPGSRRQEIERILPSIWQAAGKLEKQHPACGFIVAAPSEQIAGMIRETVAAVSGGPEKWELVIDQTREVLRQADAAWVASGTATLETALLNCPMVVVYKTSPVTYAIAKMVVKIDHIGMVNVIAGREVCPERVQYEATPGALVKALAPLLFDSPERKQMLTDLEEVRTKLGSGGAAENAARILLEELGYG